MTHSFHLIYITPQKRSLLMRKRAVITTLTEGKNHLFLSPAKESTWFHSMNIRRKNSKSQLDMTDRQNPCRKYPCRQNTCKKLPAKKSLPKIKFCEKNHCRKKYLRKKSLPKQNTCKQKSLPKKIPADGNHCSIVPSELIKNVFQCPVFGPKWSPRWRFIVIFKERPRLTSTFVYKVHSTQSITSP